MTKLEKALDDVTCHAAPFKDVHAVAELLIHEYGKLPDYPISIVFDAFKAVQA